MLGALPKDQINGSAESVCSHWLDAIQLIFGKVGQVEERISVFCQNYKQFSPSQTQAANLASRL